MIDETKPERGDEDDVDLRVAEEPEDVLPEQRVAPLRRIEEVRVDPAPVGREHRAAERDAGMAKRIMKDDAIWAQTNTGMRLSDIPGARSLKTVTMMLDGADTARRSRST